MPHDQHGYAVEVQWTGNRGEGTATYRSYGRDHRITAEGKQHEIAGSSDRVFRGDRDRWNPEELVIAALAQCHMLSYLHVAAVNGIVVVDYRDSASGTLQQEGDGGRLIEATLRPVVTLAAHHTDEDAGRAAALHHRAGELCFIANSVSFPVGHEPTTLIADR
ncbi:OsmC family protein [Microcella frigidaquae]|uniref:Organic hydroperoxide reductase OsmC/OhrA n=1 Tax=Microcella frigidaquae TaxID=424758 RepID=A0A840XQP2_9MICO|nr:OsmC family protein [Microcella frigidaquae]MBB5618868.1 organic hydroperoxide reductase OsmC/OhrA [Microcella frigidaquae]NHN44968.1 OsmC family peroxiredoxin [Microcella frigidaquae]